MNFLNLYIRENVKINIIFDIQPTCGMSERACTATFNTRPPQGASSQSVWQCMPPGVSSELIGAKLPM